MRRRRRKALSLVAITLGIAVATAVATVAVDVGDRVSRELGAAGANIVVTPAADAFPVSVGGVDFRPAGAGAYLEESSLPAMKRIFWRNSIEAFAPYLYVPAKSRGRRFVLIGTWFSNTLALGPRESLVTGIEALHPGWSIEGKWPRDADVHAALVGSQLARALLLRTGESFAIRVASGSRTFRVAGILDSGGIEDGEILAPLHAVQAMTGLEGKVRRVEVTAITKPDDALARVPVNRMTPGQFERWSCSNYASTVAYQIEQAIPGSAAQPVFQVSETEGKVLRQVGLLMALLAGAALITAGLAVSSVTLANVLERRQEIGLLKALGAPDGRVAAIFLTEAAAVGLAGGLLGYALGSELAARLGRAVFGSAVANHWVILPGAIALAVIVTLAGAALPLAGGLKAPAALALRNE